MLSLYSCLHKLYNNTSHLPAVNALRVAILNFSDILLILIMNKSFKYILKIFKKNSNK